MSNTITSWLHSTEIKMTTLIGIQMLKRKDLILMVDGVHVRLVQKDAWILKGTMMESNLDFFI